MPKGEKKGSSTRKQSRGQKKPLVTSEAKKEAPKKSHVPSSLSLVRQTVATIRKYWQPLGGIMLVYLILHVVFASGITNLSSNVNSIRAELEAAGGNSLSGALSGFGTLLASSGTDGSQTSSVIQTVLILLVSLVIIWALRQLLAGNQVGVKQAYYHAMTPLVPFLLVTAVVFIQLLPVTLGTAIISAVASTIFSPSALLTAVLIVVFLALAAWSLYMLSTSVIALYIATLPEMQPLAALRSAKNLVRFRRLRVLRRMLFLPFFILLITTAVIVPLITIASFLVVSVFYVLSLLAIVFTHTYFYSLYRSLLE